MAVDPELHALTLVRDEVRPGAWSHDRLADRVGRDCGNPVRGRWAVRDLITVGALLKRPFPERKGRKLRLALADWARADLAEAAARGSRARAGELAAKEQARQERLLARARERTHTQAPLSDAGSSVGDPKPRKRGKLMRPKKRGAYRW